MTSWNKRFFIPTLLGTSVLCSILYLQQSQAQSVDQSISVEFLPQNAERIPTRITFPGEQVVPTPIEETVVQQQPTPENLIKDEELVTQESVQTSTSSSEQLPTSVPTEQAGTTQAPESTSALQENPEPQTISVKLIIQGPGISTSGRVSVESGATVLKVLKKGSKELDFSFKTSQHSSLGVFVEGFNGVVNNPKANLYWLYYINGQFASRGVSLQTVQEGDIITWSYE